MSQHADNAGEESIGSWLPLVEYSVKSGMSASTIRRKIKTNSLRHKFDNGRYLIYFVDDAVSTIAEERPVAPPRQEAKPIAKPQEPTPVPRTNMKSSLRSEERWALPFIDRAVKLVTEAYDATLKEKDERIRMLENRNKELKEQLIELRTLVRALEEKYEVRY